MRISDWSSDVCSSDLLAPFGRRIGADDRIAVDDRRRVIASRGGRIRQHVNEAIADRFTFELRHARPRCRKLVGQDSEEIFQMGDLIAYDRAPTRAPLIRESMLPCSAELWSGAIRRNLCIRPI